MRDLGIQDGLLLLRFVTLAQGLPELQLPHDLTGEHLEGVLLKLGKLPGLVIQDAQGADGMAFGGLQQRACIEAQVRLPRDQGIAGKARVLGRVRNEKKLLFQDRLGAERAVQGRLADPQADLGLEELTMFGDEVHDGDRRFADARGQFGNLVEIELPRAVQHIEAGERLEPLILLQRCIQRGIPSLPTGRSSMALSRKGA